MIITASSADPVQFADVSLEKQFSCSVEFVGHWLRIGHADRIDIRETVIPDRTSNTTATDDSAYGVA